MKKLLCFLLCLTLIFSSVSLCFAAGWSDSQISSVVSDLSMVKTTLNNIYNRLGNIQNYLVDSSHGVAYWVQAISTWMQPIYTALTSDFRVNSGIEFIISGLNEITGDSSSGYTYRPYLKNLDQFYSNTKLSADYILSNNGGYSMSYFYKNWGDSVIELLFNQTRTIAQFYSYLYGFGFTGYNSTQSATNWGNLGTSTFTPTSTTDGIYKWFSAIQSPVARLSYVLASQERIEAQEAAAANEEAVVDNFIDSSGDGATSPSDIGSVSDLSSGYKQNFGSDASPSGIFDIFNSDHATWFSQETKNQLDTTTPTRLSKGSDSETPLLDKQIKDIYDALGVKQP